MSTIRLLYRSDSELSGSDRAVREAAFAIADAARGRNDAEGVSGALMFVGGVFVQLLEGDAPAVETVFERICRDPRHRRLTLLDYSQVDSLAFGGWGMVAFEGDPRARELFQTIGDAGTFVRGNRLSANMAVDLMRTLFKKRSARTREPRRDGMVDRMIATNVME